MKHKEIVKSSSISIVKALVSTIPVVGSALNELIFELRSTLKQERVNYFVGLLKNYFENENVDVDLEYLRTEEFGDIFESVIRKVMEKGTKEKTELFKRILTNQLENKLEPTYINSFIEKVEKLNSNQIQLLKFYEENYVESLNIAKVIDQYEKHKPKYTIINSRRKPTAQDREQQKKVDEFNDLIKDFEFRRDSFANLDKDDKKYDLLGNDYFLLKDLEYQSLIIDQRKEKEKSAYIISGFGQEFLKYIENTTANN